jgi:hypothetical protein
MRRPADVFLFYAARATRGLGDGFAIITLPAYLSELGFGPFQIGIVASLNGHRHARNRICRSQQGPAQSSVARRFRDSCDGPRISGHRAVCAHSRDRVCRHKESFILTIGLIYTRAPTCRGKGLTGSAAGSPSPLSMARGVPNGQPFAADRSRLVRFSNAKTHTFKRLSLGVTYANCEGPCVHDPRGA